MYDRLETQWAGGGGGGEEKKNKRKRDIFEGLVMTVSLEPK